MMSRSLQAPGSPGSTPHWASSAKTGVGTAIGAESPLWFTLSHGIVTEVFYPSVDNACLRGMGLIVTDRKDFISDELHDVDSEVRYVAQGVPAYQLNNRCRSGRFRIEKTVLSDPRRPVLLEHHVFQPQLGNIEDYSLYLLIAPHLGNQGHDNTAWLDDFKGMPMLFAKLPGSPWQSLARRRG